MVQQEEKHRAATCIEEADEMMEQEQDGTVRYLSEEEEDSEEDSQNRTEQDSRHNWNRDDIDYLTSNPEILLDVLQNWNGSRKKNGTTKQKEEKKTAKPTINTREETIIENNSNDGVEIRGDPAQQFRSGKGLLNTTKLENRRAPHETLWKLWDELNLQEDDDMETDSLEIVELPDEPRFIVEDEPESDMETEREPVEENPKESQSTVSNELYKVSTSKDESPEPQGERSHARPMLDIQEPMEETEELPEPTSNRQAMPEVSGVEMSSNRHDPKTKDSLPTKVAPEEYADPEEIVVRTLREVRIPPFTEKVFHGYPEEDVLCGDLLIEELPGVTETMHFAVAASLCRGTADTVICRAINPTGEDIIIPKGLCSGKSNRSGEKPSSIGTLPLTKRK